MRCVIALLALAAVALAYEGWSGACWSGDINDGYCDPECYNERNNFDGDDCADSADLCNVGCNPADIDNGYCTPWCMTEACEWDGGDCGESACGDWNCDDSDWGNNVCDLECANLDCGWDDGDCLAIGCSPTCMPDDIGDSWCDWDCYTADCLYDLDDCEDYCSPGCLNSDKDDGNCDAACLTDDCDQDNGDCEEYMTGRCSWSCLDSEATDSVCQYYCYNEDCDWDNGSCDDEYCGPYMCDKDNLNDGDCDPDCNNDDCDYDGGDCEYEYVYYEAMFTDDTCIGDVISVDASYWKVSSDCESSTTTQLCTTGNVGYACVSVDDFDALMDDWFDSDPSWSADFNTEDCSDLPNHISYLTTADCVLMNNALWGYYEWSSEGIVVTHVCTDEECDNCFVQPDGTGLDLYYYDCWTDGSESHQTSGASVVAAGLLALVFAVFAMF
ncbi:hypothetical protein Pelo_8787 [Pelomyxa schiedti]|nr:hypothetical protein Pelo_8787 [Pelomyxa schiedti]